LFELLAEAAVTIPELGTRRAAYPPIVVLTSNRTRDLHDALKRRCLYHWIDYPDVSRVAAIVRRRVPDATGPLADQVAAGVAGLPVGPGRAERFATAVTVARPGTPRAQYLCALTTLVSSKEHALILRAVFEQVFGDTADAGPAAEPGLDGIGGLPDWSSEHLLASAAKAAQQHTAG